MSRRRSLLVLALAAGCSRTQPVDTRPTTPATAATRADPARERFEQFRVRGGFTRDAYVVWSPVWPTAGDEVTVLYDARAPLAPFRGGSTVTWFLTPESGDALTRAMPLGPGGIATVTEHAAVLRPGWFVFGQGERRDNDCGNPWKLAIVPESPQWREATSAHFRYRWLPGDPVADRIREVLDALESHLAMVVATLGIEMPAEPAVFLHYASRDIGFAYQAHHGNNADEFRHMVFSAEAPDDAHELTHLLVNEQLGRHHEGLFDEGLATRLGQELSERTGWQGRSCDSWARDGIARGELPPLSTLAPASKFYAAPWTPTGGILLYGAACSFVADLIERYGAARLRSLLHDLSCDNQDDGEAVATRFEAAFGVSLEAADSAWRRKLAPPADAGPRH
jgi:hypothetical protein